MASSVRLACLQMSSLSAVEENLNFVDRQLSLAADQAVEIVLLPENFAQMPKHSSEQHIELQGKGIVQEFLSAKAKQYQLLIIAGSVPIQDTPSAKPYARCLVFDGRGQQIGSYDKIHLFDVALPGGQSYRESETYLAGDANTTTPANLVVVPSKLAKLGLTICYDLRFPEMYRQLVDLGAELIVVPAAFTYDTGRAHWRTLLRARAIENQVFIMAAAQVGKHANLRETWGHSMIIDPWGEVLAEFSPTTEFAAQTSGENDLDGNITGLLIADIQLSKLQQLRNSFPALQHRRL